ncbi:class I SAM-dependent methyltransferase [Nonomuraea sp. MTCD27]|uniref:class I SAM-dependent DNA methyltransferase n=1 Tax=Nonomuraea sp. MTCD27 TaxID=1676747 RepID=UPI0035BEE843
MRRGGHSTAAQPAYPTARANDYDSFAEAYSAETENSLINAYIARPAIMALAGDVAGRRILDAGCGSGPLSAALRERGAVVTGVDAGAGMLAVARRRLGDDADLHVADLRDPLPFDDGAFDDVVASLVLNYLEDGQPFPMTFWRRPLQAMTDAFAAAGFRLAVISEPKADPAAREVFPDDFPNFADKLAFLCFVVEVPPPDAGADA